MKYPCAETFKSVQGEGVYTGTPMFFIRFTGCSVGKAICTCCDTDFERIDASKGGGLFTPEQLLEMAGDYSHICITGGEPLDRDLLPLLKAAKSRIIHIETSGTKYWSRPSIQTFVWLTVSPKPKYLETMIAQANEVKVILGGLGDGPDWPTLEDAVRWSKLASRPVFIQPRNEKYEASPHNTQLALEAVLKNPSLRLSTQLHKYLEVR